MTTLAIAAAVIVVGIPLLTILIVKGLYKTPAADQALIITGWGIKGATVGGRTFKIVTGRGVLVIPGLQRVQALSLSADKAMLQVEGVDKQKVPVGVRGVVLFKVGDSDQEITNAAIRFLSDQAAQRGATSQMHDMVTEVLHGHLRSIIGGLSVEDLIANRNELAQETRVASADEVQKLGLIIDSLQIQEIVDVNGYIAALGAPRAAEIQMQARIAAADRDREATEREQAAAQLRAAAQRDTALKAAGFQAEQDAAMSKSAQAGPLAEAEARKAVVERETEVAELEAQREESRLVATVNKPADAQAYEARVRAEGMRAARIALAEAQARETELAAGANAQRVQVEGAAEAKATQLRGEAEGAAIRAKGIAEADAIGKRATALERQSEAVIGQQLAEQLPAIVEAAAKAFANVDNLTVLNGAQGMSEIMAQVVGQVGPVYDMARRSLNGNGHAGNGSAPASERSEEGVGA